MNRAGSAAHAAEPSTPVRPFANEDIFFYVKRIDNSRVVRAADPEARQACWKMIGSVVAAAVLLIVVLLPGRLQSAGGLSDSNAAPGGAHPGQRRRLARTAGSRAALAGSHAGTGSPAAVCGSAAAEGGLSGRTARCAGGAERRTARAGPRKDTIRRKTCHAPHSHHSASCSGCCGCCWRGPASSSAV